MHTYIHMCVYIYIYTYTYMYIHIDHLGGTENARQQLSLSQCNLRVKT